jgi:hypothetical protein
MLAILGSQSDVAEGPRLPFRLANNYERFEGSYCHNLEAQRVQVEVGNWALYPEDEGGTILRNVDN